jgi:hypothetical protein
MLADHLGAFFGGWESRCMDVTPVADFWAAVAEAAR